MMKRIAVNCGQLGVTPSSPTSTHSCNKRPSRLMVFASSWLPYATHNNSNTFIASASSSSSISGGSGSHSSSSSIFFSFHSLKSMQTRINQCKPG
ncbi:alpha/beta fold hydrolase [Trifolium medium]|uniref:Alpha/beta fold hydrolase n=1 Tax=Trifolium medium TaxID=97028 RepID=A0A392P615_9FABA|nr:alpha/beta fold hydrolase [Trifolium medium]